MGLDESLSYLALMITGVILTVGAPFVGMLADKLGRLKVMLPAATLIGAAVVPLFGWATAGRSFTVLLVGMALLGLLKARYFGALPSVMADTFPARTRATGLSFSYNTTVSIFGGLTPMIATSLIALTNSSIAPGYYILATACVSIVALLAGNRRRGFR
ncbi:MFS transporter [Tamaricihabitans halophyticus]|uniref:MFS transporter n=1 Tax=Tamaricihabitans halophyticus TaxID=1262583 RepID=A0A4R2QDW6_9PSEU|nr:MFS transporter [Tamaricihabitans halophyticus]TCP46839.1 MFS transporter [Tamaricihabitans halophyticus]